MLVFITHLDCQDFNWMPGNPSDKRFMYEVSAFCYYLTMFVFCVLSTLSFTHLSHAASSVQSFYWLVDRLIFGLGT